MDWINEDGTRCAPQPTTEEIQAIQRLADGEMPSYSTGICGSTTWGYGTLDENGYWEFPLPPGFWKAHNNEVSRVMPGLTQCQNPLHTYWIGRLLIGWQIAQDYWALRDRSGNRVRRWLAVETVKALDGDEVILNFVVLRLSLSFGWQRGA